MAVARHETPESVPGWERVPAGVAYRHVRDNLTRLLADRPAAGDLAVAACPEWTVRDVVAHLVGICASVAVKPGGRSAARPLPDADAVLADLLAAWAVVGEQAERLIAGARRGGVMMMDAFTHELDIRYALGVPPPDEHPAYPGALDVVVGGFSAEVSRRGLPPLLIETAGAQWVAGGEDLPAATLRAGRYDLYRSLAGRRTHAQITRLRWSEPPRPWLPAFAWGPFEPPVRQAESEVGNLEDDASRPGRYG